MGRRIRLNLSLGFTLVELVVSVALVVVIMSFVSITLNSASFRLKSEIRGIRSAMQQARLEAVKRNKNVFLDFDHHGTGQPQALSMWVCEDAAEEPLSFDEGEDLLIFESPGISPSNTSGGVVRFGVVPSDLDGPTVPALRGASGGTLPNGGIDFDDLRISFRPDGTTSEGALYLHVPNNPQAGTYAIVLNGNGHAYLRYFATGSSSWVDR